MAKVLSETRRLKGQMFFIAALFMIVGFVMLAGLIFAPEIVQEKQFQENSYVDRTLRNIRNEYEYTAGLAPNQNSPNQTGPAYLYNFSSLVRNNENAKILYVAVYSNGTTKNFTVTVGNFLQDGIAGTITPSGLAPSAFALADKSSATYNYSATGGIYTVAISYTLQNTQVSDQMTFNVSARNQVSGFFDITLRDGDYLVRSKSVYNRTW